MTLGLTLIKLLHPIATFASRGVLCNSTAFLLLYDGDSDTEHVASTAKL